MSPAPKLSRAFTLAFLLASTAATAQSGGGGDRNTSNRFISPTDSPISRRVEIYEPPSLSRRSRPSMRRMSRRSRPGSASTVSLRGGVQPWWEVFDDVAARRRDRRAAWYFGLAQPYYLRRYQ